MKLREFLSNKTKSCQYTLIIQKAVKDENSPFYIDMYRTTPIRNVQEWLEGTTADKYIVISKDHPPIDETAGVWMGWYNNGTLGCCMVSTEQDLLTKYGEKQGRCMIGFYDRKVRN